MSPEPVQMRNHWWWRLGWATGRRFLTWHLTLAGQDDVHRLAAQYRDVLKDVEGLSLIPDPRLHLSEQGITLVDEIAETYVEAIVQAARRRLAAVPAFDIEVGADPVVLDPEAILLHVRSAAPVAQVRDAIRAALGDVLAEVPEAPRDSVRTSPSRMRPPTGPSPHLTLSPPVHGSPRLN